LGEANFMIREYKTGIVWYEKAILTNPANLLIKNNYATRLALTKTDIKTARELINAVLKESPNNLVFQATEGLVLLQEGKYKEALTILKKVNETQPNERNYVDYLGDAYFFNGETNSAVENWKKAKELGAKNKSIEKKISERKYVDPIY
jgi:predicted Zn-dependent protease